VAKEAIPALVKLREAGLVKAVGFSGLPLKMFTKLLDLVEPGGVAKGRNRERARGGMHSEVA